MLKLNSKSIFYLFLYAVPNTLLSFGFIYIINNALGGNPNFVQDYMSIVFVALIVYTYLLNVIFQKWLNKYSFNLLYQNEKNVFSQILKAPLQKLEKLGSHRFFTVIEDLRTFSMLPYTVTHTINSLLMVVLCVIYMFTLSIPAALIVIGLIVLIAGCYFIVMNSMSKKVTQLREYNEDYYQYVDDVMKGFKDLKLSFFRRTNLMNRFLIPNRDKAQLLDFNINYIFLSINLISQYGLYFVIAVILFMFPLFGLLEQSEVIAYVVIILFISGPINNLINLQQMYTRFLVASKRIKKFTEDFETIDDSYFDRNKEEDTISFSSLSFRDVQFSYDKVNEDASVFSLGPLNLDITKGETIFIVGGNGSGKSTFVNVLTGLYKKTEGSIILNDGHGENTVEKLQDLMAAVFTDNHVFAKNYENFELENNEKYEQLLKKMKLEDLIDTTKEESVRRKFSKGQSKRVSMIFALLEDKPILVLDEWAADQDPYFRKYFYEELLPKFKAEGKTIIAVTHDDAYFHLADRVIKFDYGKISKDITVDKKEKLSNKIWA